MDEVSRSGRTVLFVSHNLGSLAQICNKGLLLHKGELRSFGDIRTTIDDYLTMSGQETEFSIGQAEVDPDLNISGVRVINRSGCVTAEVPHDEEFYVSIDLNARKFRRGAMVCVALLNKYKRRVFTEHRGFGELLGGTRGEYEMRFRIPGEFVAPNSYSFLVQIFCLDGDIVQELFDICPFDVIDTGSELAAYRDHGYVLVKGEWQVSQR